MKAADASELQAAIEGGELVSPYVALNQDTGEIFYDNFVPEEPEVQTMGTWENVGSAYTFTITDNDYMRWVDWVHIGTMKDVYYEGNQEDIDIYLRSIYQGDWELKLVGESMEPGDEPSYVFYVVPELFESGVMVDENESNSSVDFYWDGSAVFTIPDNINYPLDITTYDPEQGPQLMGLWSDDGAGTYHLEYLADPTMGYWDNWAVIGTLIGVYYNGAKVDMTVELMYDDTYIDQYQNEGAWVVRLSDGEGGDEEHTFGIYSSEEWSISSVDTENGASDSNVEINWSENGFFEFYTNPLSSVPLSMSTQNPEYQAPEE